MKILAGVAMPSYLLTTAEVASGIVEVKLQGIINETQVWVRRNDGQGAAPFLVSVTALRNIRVGK